MNHNGLQNVKDLLVWLTITLRPRDVGAVPGGKMLLTSLALIALIESATAAGAPAPIPAPQAAATAATPATPGAAAQSSDDKDKAKTPAPPPVHEEIQVTATRYEADSFTTPVPISVVSATELGQKLPEKMVDVLKLLPSVDVNGEGPFRGLPVIRGLDSNRVLILVDGQRLNNARESTQYAGIQPGLVDLSLVDRIEVVRGPSSVLYGSDAIGGVINIITKQQAFHQGAFTYNGTAGYDYGSSATSQRGHVDVNGAGERTTFHLGASAFQADDYTTPEGKMPNSGMKQRSFDGNMRFLVSDTGVLRFGVEATQTRDVGFPGYDPATSGVDISFPRFDRTKFTTSYETGPFAGLNGLSLNAYYQALTKESIRNFDFGGFFLDNFTRSEIHSVGFNAQSSADLGSANHLTFGLDSYRDTLHDDTTESSPLGSDNNVAVPDSDQTGVGVYVQDAIAASQSFQLIVGARGDHYAFVSHDDPRYTGTPFDVSQTAASGNVSARYEVTRNVALTALVGRGFRAPNLQERAFFGVATTGDTYILQNPDLKPETSLNYELGFKVRYDRYSGGFNVYHNNVRDLINTVFLGTDPNTGLQLAQFQNIDRSTIQGVEFELQDFISDRVTAFVNASYSRGTDDKTGEPLALIAPVKAVLGARYQVQRYWGELTTRMVGRQDRVAPGYTATPGFATIDVRGGLDFANGFRVEGAVENVGDVAYHEPFNTFLEPGRNVKVSVGYRF